MGVKLLDSLEMQTGLPLDNRDIVNNIDERNNIEPAVRYIGMEVYVIEENKKYRLEEGIENFNWQEMKSKAVASELITDDDHMTVSKAEKDTWNSKAEGNHNHDGMYQPVGNYSLDTHNHDNSYSKLNHAHTSSEIGTYTKEEIDNKVNTKSDLTHKHNEYQPTGNYPTKEEIYTKSDVDKLIEEINSKFKSYCPISVGSIDVRYDSKNPAEIYQGTTWELLTAGKYIQTGNTALSVGGSNSISIAKANLPNIKLKTDATSATIGNHYHYMFATNYTGGNFPTPSTYVNYGANKGSSDDFRAVGTTTLPTVGRTSNAGAGNTGAISPSTEALGNGTPLSIQPSYITLKFWKRLT